MNERSMSNPRSLSSGVQPATSPSSSAAAAAAARRERARSVWLGVLVVCATVVAYLPALKAGFVWNDIDYVTAPKLRSLGGLERIWFELGATEQYYPLLHSAFWLQHRVFGDDPAGYHVVNLLLHLSAVILFAAVLRKLLAQDTGHSTSLRAFDTGPVAGGQERRRYAGVEWLAAALFALHPVHVASVAWITEQKNTLSLVLYLAAFLIYLRFDETRRPRSYYSALALFGLSILGKTSTVTLPAALLVVFWWRRGRLEWKREVGPLLPWLVLGAAAGIFSSWIEGHTLGGRGIGAEGPEFDLSLPGHVLLAGRAIWFYLGSLVWPFDLNFIYPRWTVDGTVWWQWLFPLAVVAVLVVLWALRGRDRTPLAVFLLFAGTLVPVLGFVNLYGSLYSRVWDHWQYHADLAPLALAGVALAHTGAWAGPRFRRAGPALGVALCVLFGALTWQRCGDFQNEETLYRTTLARNPDCWLAHNNLGRLLALTPEGLPEAIEHYAAAGRLDPGRAELHYNLANGLAKTGRVTEAEDEYEAALRLDPNYAEAHNALGNLLTHIDGRLPDAIAHYEQAVRLAPAMPDVHNNLGIALLMAGSTEDAIDQFKLALRLNPNLAQAHANLAAALESVGRTGEAAAHVEAARRLGFAVPQPRD
jgi:tetratricopeptide (TPR) repeat protein